MVVAVRRGHAHPTGTRKPASSGGRHCLDLGRRAQGRLDGAARPLWSAPAFRDTIQGAGMSGDLPAFAPRQLKGVGNLPQPQRPFTLYLHSAIITDADLKELAGLKNLQGLDLGVTKVTDAGLKELANLKGLRWLKIPATQVTDAGLKELAALKSLQVLDLGVTRGSLGTWG